MKPRYTIPVPVSLFNIIGAALICRPYYLSRHVISSEVEADGGEERSGTGGVEIVVRDIRQTEVVA